LLSTGGVLGLCFAVASSSNKSNSVIEISSTDLVYSLEAFAWERFWLFFDCFAGLGLGIGLDSGTAFRIFMVIRDFPILTPSQVQRFALGLLRSTPLGNVVRKATNETGVQIEMKDKQVYKNLVEENRSVEER
jgi:hypothetical protein